MPNYRILKVHNNNLATARDDAGHEVIVMGSGIAFQRRIGDLIHADSVEKVFMPRDAASATRIETQIRDIRFEVLSATDEIIHMIEQSISVSLDDKIYLALADHIQFALDRVEKHIVLQNMITDEIRHYYKTEYALGCRALEILRTRIGADFPQGEAGFIAMHIVNAVHAGSLHDSMTAVEFLGDVIGIIERELSLRMDRDSISYYRLASHLKLFAHYMASGELDALSGMDDAVQDKLFHVLAASYPALLRCTEIIADYVQERHGIALSKEERILLVLYILPTASRHPPC